MKASNHFETRKLQLRAWIVQGPYLFLSLCLQIKKRVEARHPFDIGQNPGKTYSQYAVGDSKKPYKKTLFISVHSLFLSTKIKVFKASGPC